MLFRSMENRNVFEGIGQFGGMFILCTIILDTEVPTIERIGAIGNLIQLLSLLVFQGMIVIALYSVYTEDCGESLCWKTKLNVNTMVGAVASYTWLYLYSNTLFRKHVGTPDTCYQGIILMFLDFFYNTAFDVAIQVISLGFCLQYSTDTFSLLTTVVSITFVCEIDEKIVTAIFNKPSYADIISKKTLAINAEHWRTTRRVMRGLCWLIMCCTLAGVIVWASFVVDNSNSCACFECCQDSPACKENDDCWDIQGWSNDVGYCGKMSSFAGSSIGKPVGIDPSEFCDWSYTTLGTCGQTPSIKTVCTDLQELMNRCFYPNPTIQPWCVFDSNEQCICPFPTSEYCYDGLSVGCNMRI